MSVTRKWTLLAAVLALAILAAGWFLLVSPKRGEAADLRAEAVTQAEANERLVQQLQVLKAQQEELPRQRARLAIMQAQIPNNPALPSLIRDLTAAGRKVGVSIDAMSPAVPVPVVAAQVVAPAPTTTSTDATATGTTASDATATDSATDAAATGAPAPVPPSPSLFQVPLTLEVSGSYFELEQFVNKLEGLERSFLVSGFTVTPVATPTTADVGGAGPDAPSPGDLTIAIQGRVFLSPVAAAAAVTQPTPATGTEPAQ